MPTFKTSTILTDLDGHDIVGGNGIAQSIAYVATHALTAELEGDALKAVSDRTELYQLAKRFKADEITTTGRDLAVLMPRVSLLYPTVTVGAVADLMDVTAENEAAQAKPAKAKA